MIKQMNIPELRFPEFEGEWEKKPLIELSENGFSNGAFNDPRKVGEGYRIINVKDMYVDGTINVDSLTKVAIDESEFLKNRVEYGDIFFTRSSLVKEGIAYSNVNLNDVNDLTFDGHLIRMRPKKEKHSSVFLYYNFGTAFSREQFVKRGKTTTMTTIGQEDIATVEIIFASLPEQQKIASFLTSIDTKLTQLKKKKSLLEQYKKGIMQKIFSQELRFRDEDGKEFGEWEQTKIGKLGDIITGSTPPTANREFYNGQYFFVSPIDISENRFVINTKTKLTRIGFLKGRKIRKGSTLFVCIGSTIGKIAQANNDCITNQQINSIVPIDNNDNFIFSLLQFHSEIIKGLAATQAVPIINKTTFSEYALWLPSIEEQTKIANFLSAIDEKINHCTMQIEKMEQWKKGLLQKMFC